MWKALDNRWVSRAGNLAFLLGALQGVVRVLMGLSLANALTVVLIVAGVALMATPYLSRLRSAQPATPSEAADPHMGSGRVYGNAAIRQAIAEAAEDEDRKALAREINNMIREGRELVAELSVPVQPERTANGWKIEGGGPSAEQQEKANDFRRRAVELIEQRNPILLADYRDGCNDYIRRPHDEIEASNPSADSRSDAEKMLALASAERRTAVWEVEVCLEGLARAGGAI